MKIEKHEATETIVEVSRPVKIRQDVHDIILEKGDRFVVIPKGDLNERVEENVGRFILVDGMFTDTWAVAIVDPTHIYMSVYVSKMPSAREIQERGAVYHIAQIKGMAKGLYEAVQSWVNGRGSLDNEVFRR